MFQRCVDQIIADDAALPISGQHTRAARPKSIHRMIRQICACDKNWEEGQEHPQLSESFGDMDEIQFIGNYHPPVKHVIHHVIHVYRH